ncbi:D-alanyl-D-alanine carboxypeptidase [Phyllobacterium sp. P30BS-XVII]|uniref:D-alanyl-D-alanine carboxypeptidase n=1 Tax=Phyllobacterium sp. P30BS-XVII TaxID=2587046 RepID=UPI0015FCC813|nr:D-alanyl-D-alanine carboxypeptidase [Phyllobacterium sp. P30BS-XVII]MBA8903521.1 D-alanyl-D-alanine carboxypeptidase/D-alanyl-D-alanine carboxypeptidase (penicillin-binding protein 5/6) [Phyllobacterium sp. P30BS-XVII]
MPLGLAYQSLLSRLRLLVAGIACLAVGLPVVAQAAEQPWFVLDVSTGKVLGEGNANTPHGPASLAKMMTLYLTFEAIRKGRLHWDDRIAVSANAARKVPAKLWMRAGDTLSVREAVNGMIILSANDAASAMGEHLGGTEARFAQQMTMRGRQLGLRNTVFRNASGLTEKGQSTTARDMATLGVAVMRDFPKEYGLFSQRSFVFRGKQINGHNNLMYRYAGVDGIKTGYTDAAGFNLVSSFTDRNRHIVGVVLGGKTGRSRDDRMAQLLDQYMPMASDGAKRSRDLVAGNAVAETNPVVASAIPVPRAADRSAVVAQRKPGIAELIDESKIEQGDGGLEPLKTPAQWNIQIGAVDTRADANRLLGRADKLVHAILPGAKGYIEPASKRGAQLYRVRFGGFSDAQAASAACSELKRRSFACIASRN